MRDDLLAALRVGTRLAYDGQMWQVAELTPPSLLLAGAAGSLRRVGAGHLLADPSTRLLAGSEGAVQARARIPAAATAGRSPTISSTWPTPSLSPSSTSVSVWPAGA